MSLFSLSQQKTIKIYQNFSARNLKDQCIRTNIKQKVRIKLQETSIDIFFNQALYEFYDQTIYADVKRYKEIRKLQHEKANIMLLSVCWIMITSKTIKN